MDQRAFVFSAHLLPKSITNFCDCTYQFVYDLIGTPRRHILFWPKISAKTTEILAQDTSKMHKTHSETPINQKFLGGGDPIWFRFVRPCVRAFKNLARGLKFHIWIPHKTVDPYFLSELSPLVELCPFLRVRVQFCKCIPRILLKLGVSNFFSYFRLNILQYPYIPICSFSPVVKWRTSNLRLLDSNPDRGTHFPLSFDFLSFSSNPLPTSNPDLTPDWTPPPRPRLFQFYNIFNS